MYAHTEITEELKVRQTAFRQVSSTAFPPTGQARGPRLIHPPVSGRQAGEAQMLPPRGKSTTVGTSAGRGLFCWHAWAAGPQPLRAERREARERGCGRARGRALLRHSAGPPHLCRPQGRGPRLGSNGRGAAVTLWEGHPSGPAAAGGTRQLRNAPFPPPPPWGEPRRRKPAALRCGALTMLPAAVYLASGTAPAPAPCRPSAPRRLRANSHSPARGVVVTVATGGAMGGAAAVGPGRPLEAASRRCPAGLLPFLPSRASCAGGSGRSPAAAV